MTAIERALVARVQRQVGVLTQPMITAILSAFRAIAQSLPESDLARIIAAGSFELVVATVFSEAALNVAFRSVRTELQRTLGQAIRYTARDLPGSARTIGVQFDVLNPKVLEALRAVDNWILPTLKSDVRESVRQAVAAGLEARMAPRAIARGLRDVVGLSPAQELAVRNYRAELESGRFAKAASRELADARFSSTTMTAAKIDRMVASYRKNFTAFHAETIARTATLDAYKRAQMVSWQQAIDAGIVDGGRLRKQWIQVDRPTKRESHIPLNGETVPFNQVYSNGQMIPGEGEFNCACLSRVFLSRAA